MKPQDVPYPKLSLPYAVATGFYSGAVPVRARGTVGSLASLAAAFWLLPVIGALGVLLGAIFFFLIGYWAVQELERALEVQYHDASCIVVDEWCGQWLSVAAAVLLVPSLTIGGQFFMAFVLFRLFDVVKPWPIKRIDVKIPGAMGVMLDDVVAAIMAGVVMAVFIA